MKKSRRHDSTPQVSIRSEVLRQVRQHARSSMKNEVCGVLVGHDRDGAVRVEACIAGVNAAQGNAHVTFTQDTWEHIYSVKDREYPDHRIVGWYHSHPGFGVFLSDHDQFIQQNFFSSPGQIAWVYDPHSDEEGCFGWSEGRIRRLSEVHVRDDATAVPASTLSQEDPADAGFELSAFAGSTRASWGDITFTALSYLAAVALGVLLAFLLLPRQVVVQMTPEDIERYLRERGGSLAVTESEQAVSAPAGSSGASAGRTADPARQSPPASPKK